jgi:hypothetical protein
MNVLFAAVHETGYGRASGVAPVHTAIRNCTRDEGGPFRGWINDYSNFYRTQLRSTLKRIDLYVIRWARRKFKRLRLKTKGARDWFDRLRRTNPTLLAHWQLCHGNGRASGAV